MKRKCLGGLLLLALIGIGTGAVFLKRQPPLLHDKFQSESNWKKQCTKTDIHGDAVMPVLSGPKDGSPLQSTYGMLHLNTGAPEHAGGGEWCKAVEIHVDKDMAIEWRWTAIDTGDYQFWVRLRFNNHRAIFYQASDARPPGAYRSGKWAPYEGEAFRDRDGRRRFLPSVCMMVSPPNSAWTVLRRNLADDYLRCYGDLPAHLAISDITIGMVDDSPQRINELGVEYIKVEANQGRRAPRAEPASR
jgi:hypothetical protein